MAFQWEDKTDLVDDVLAEDINSVAHQVIQNEQDISDLWETINSGGGGGNGADGVSPVVSVEQISGGHRVTITDINGDKVFNVMDGENGQDGRGIVNITRTSGDGSAGSTDTYTIFYTDNTTSTFQVYNGANGSGGEGSGENGATFIPSVDAAGNLSWTNDKGLSNPSTVNIKGEKGDKGDTGLQGIQGVQGEKGEKGDAGQNGYTPQRGVDYWTNTDKTEIVASVLDALPRWSGGSY